MSFAEVAVQTDVPYRQAFSYAVPPGMTVTPGSGVLVPFGPRTLPGVVLGIGERPLYDGETRNLLAAAGALLAPHQIALASWTSRRYLAPLYPCVAVMLPPGFEKRLRIAVTALDVEPPPSLDESARRLLARIREEGEVDVVRLRRWFRAATGPALALLRAQGLIGERLVYVEGKASASGGGPSPPAPPTSPPPPLLQGEGSLIQPMLHEAPPSLVGKGGGGLGPRDGGWGPVSEEATSRAHAERFGTGRAPFDLTPAQHTAVAAIVTAARQAFTLCSAPTAETPIGQRQVAEVGSEAGSGRRPPVFLLHGVTGSGKTEVYLAALERIVAAGRRGIVLVPEIALTPQAVARFEARFPGGVAVVHSEITGTRRERLWHEIRAGRYAVVVGARSAIFAPQPDLGLIVLDEEHEWTYKQHEGEPRYHARDVALRLAGLTGATVVLGSATPDVVSYARARAGQYTLLRLPERVGNAVLPSVEVVDLALELRAGNRGIFSRALEAALEETLARGEQAMLFLNRRGSAGFVLCRECGHVPSCSGCQIPYTVHAPAVTGDLAGAVLALWPIASAAGGAGAARVARQAPHHGSADRLRCHHCNRQRRMPPRCPACNGSRVRLFGLGTQRVEAEVRARFPEARVLRWDADAARSAADHAAILRTLAAGEADIVVGTQMLAKGHDLPNVTLVGVVSADIALNLPDYRSGERAYQLLTQVAGRAGRGQRPGRVIVQTYTPEHYAIRAAATHDYEAMYREELDTRREAGYPPFARLTRLLFSHTNAAYAEEEARRLAGELRTLRALHGLPGVEVRGPAPAFHARVRGRWRWQIVLRAHAPGELLGAATLRRGWTVDVDPVTLV